MKKILLLAFLLAGCNGQQVISSKEYMVVRPDEAMYNCPVLKQWPKWNTLKDSEVAKVLLQLQKNNLTGKSSVESIRTFLDNADKTLKKGG